MKYIFTVILLLLFVPIMAQSPEENIPVDNPVNTEEIREDPEPFEDVDVNEAENLETDEEEEDVPEALDIDDTDENSDEFYYVEKDLGNAIINLVKAFQGDDTLTGFIVEPSTLVTVKNEELFDVSLKKGDQVWTVLPRTGEVVLYMDFSNIEEREKAKEQGDKKLLFQKAIEFLNQKGISLVGYKIDIENVLWSVGAYEWTFENKVNEKHEGFEQVQNITIDISPINNKICYFEKDINPTFSLSEEVTTDPDELVKTTMGFFTEEEINTAKLMFSGSDPYYEENLEKVVITVFVMGEDDAKNTYLFSYDAYGKQLVEITPLQETVLPEDVKAKAEEYKSKTPNVIQPPLSVQPYAPLTAEEQKALNPSKEEIEYILLKSPKKATSETSYNIKNYKKLKGSEDIWTTTKDGKNYIYREGSPWRLENNNIQDMGGSFRVEKNKVVIPNK